MHLKYVIGTAAIIAINVLPRVSAEEIGDGQLVSLLLSEGIMPQFGMSSATGLQNTKSALPAAQAQESVEGCEVLRWDRKTSSRPSMGIRRPGKYCLDQDYEFECSIFAHGCGGKMISIRASNVDLDFRGHTLRMSGTRGYTGVWGLGQNIRVHNGRIQGAGLGITLMNRGASPGNAYPVLQVDTKDVFTETGFVVEHMQFDDVVSAVTVAGSGNRIRDNVIDASLDAKATSGPPFAVLSYGPSARIERNTLRLHNLTPGSNGYAIYLRAADGTVVEGNTVRVDDTPTGTIGVGLSNSKGVSLRRNRIDTEKSTELDERSSIRQ
jgi:putative cofactor-binding repeat protein